MNDEKKLNRLKNVCNKIAVVLMVAWIVVGMIGVNKLRDAIFCGIILILIAIELYCDVKSREERKKIYIAADIIVMVIIFACAFV